MIRTKALCVILLASAVYSYAEERILSFHADITVNKDASLRVAETITVRAEGNRIKRGITRLFPLKYSSSIFTNYAVPFVVQKVFLDGKPVAYHLENAANGVVIFTGNKHIFLKPGVYTYVIEYEAKRLLGFFPDHDELNWNVIGTDSPFVIDKISARVTLPEGIPANKIKSAAYIGRYGARGTAYTEQVYESGASFASTRSLRPGEAFTIVVGWPKGFVDAPTAWQKLVYFITDNIALIVLLFGIIVLLFLYFWFIGRARSHNPQGTIIPLFYPPKDISPGLCRYIKKQEYDDNALAAEILDLAVKGYLTIEQSSQFWMTSYILKCTDKSWHTASEPEKKLLKKLFPNEHSDKELILSKSNKESIKRMQEAREYASLRYNLHGENYFVWHEGYIAIFAIVALVIAIASLWLGGGFSGWIFPYGIFAIISGIMFTNRVKGYTPEGRKIIDEIDGFLMFLTATEIDRMRVIGTPPTKTPELYETYLPYAMALGVEDQWSKQFAPVFESLKKAGHEYAPYWYIGSSPFRPLYARDFGKGFNNSVHSIASYTISSGGIPGSSSGFGGGGGAGRGGGGGGVGGW